ncbi:MAG TPA: hypothetical protein VGK34_08005 [Armatimonadota bacterium]|jgi:uncharacterized protein YjeT (DUF2065 family)
MIVLCWIIAGIYGLLGVISLVSPKLMRQWSEWSNTPIRISISKYLALFIGIFFWSERFKTNAPAFIAAYGILVLIAGLIYSFLPRSTSVKINARMVNVSDMVYRVYGIITLLFAAGFVYAALGR